MKILHISSEDISGGAARAAYRLLKGLQELGIDCSMAVQKKVSDDNSVIGPGYNISKGLTPIKILLDQVPKLYYRNRAKTVFNLQWFPDFLLSTLKSLKPDIVHLHWICHGFLNIKTLNRLPTPIVWTFHDMWPFTGGCHYAGDCDGYERACGNCPQLGSSHPKDLSRWTWWRKHRHWKNLNLKVITPSTWLKNHVQNSSLLGNSAVRVIPYGIDLTRYKPVDRQIVRELLGLSKDKQLILFGALQPVSDSRKGYKLLLPAIEKIYSTAASQQIELVILGASQSTESPDFKLKTTYLGKLHDDISIAAVYAACDVFVIPSLEDNLPNTVIEALACGTPCVGFNIGGIPEMIEHEKNGYIAASLDIDDLANGIMWVLKDAERWKFLSRSARKTAEREYDTSIIAKRYAELYQNILT
jgi:glycosyltransferase involved in cell wall biosynthesis